MTESQHQAAVIKWSLSVRGKYPELRLLYHVLNERKCSAAEGENLKRAGVKPGVPDLFLPVARGRYHGLYIEMKAETGKESLEQAWWREELSVQGYFSTICRGWESAVKTIEWYLGLGAYK